MINKSIVLAYIAAISVSAAGTTTVSANDIINGDELKAKAEHVLRSEPGAKQVKVRVEVEPKSVSNHTRINFSELDINKDGVFSREEVGEKLFEVFDRDGNQVIDNLEMKRVGLITLSPMTKKTIETIDYHSTGTPQKVRVNEEEFYSKSKLSMFDKNDDGLSPLDFLDMSFNKVDVRRDNVIDLYEWKRAYAVSVKRKHEEDFNYNG